MHFQRRLNGHCCRDEHLNSQLQHERRESSLTEPPPRTVSKSSAFNIHIFIGRNVRSHCTVSASVRLGTPTGEAVVRRGCIRILARRVQPGWVSSLDSSFISTDFWHCECVRTNVAGWGFYCAIISVFLAFACASLSVRAEANNHQTKIIRRVEAGERLICVPWGGPAKTSASLDTRDCAVSRYCTS